MPAPPFDLAQAHRWFAIEFNNQAWELVEKPSRSTCKVGRKPTTANQQQE